MREDGRSPARVQARFAGDVRWSVAVRVSFIRRAAWASQEVTAGEGRSMSKAQVQRLGRQLGWFARIWLGALAAMLLMALMIHLATGS